MQPDGAISTHLLVATGMVLALALSTLQSLIGAKVGSDHPVHVFLTKAIRNNGYRLFVRIPRLLNTCYCAAVPLYIHWIVSHFRAPSALYWSERLLNPLVNTLHVGVFALLAAITARLEGMPTTYIGLATCVFALTPQFYHALSARNFGLSARGTGLLLLTLFFLVAYGVDSGVQRSILWPVLVALGWLIWGFSTFAQQALCFISLILLFVSGRYVPLLGAGLGVLLFVALHPTYSMSYLRETVRFMRTYSKELAPLYILHRRRSLWLDLVWDIWARFRLGAQEALHYAYENSFLVILFLNPMVVLGCWATLRGATADTGIVSYAGALTVAGTLAMLLTSFRPTRFLGEPERYAEAVTPWATLCGAYYLQAEAGAATLLMLVGAFLVIDLLQLQASRTLVERVKNNVLGLEEVERAIAERLGNDVRFCSNNEQLTKLLMAHDWEYAYCLAVGQDYCGMKVKEAFSRFPYLRREACARIVSSYRVNACLLDRTQYDTLFDAAPRGLHATTVAYESDRFRLLVLDWESPASGA